MYENFPGAAMIVSLVAWLCFWDSPTPLPLSAARPGWRVWPKPALAYGHALQHLCQPASLALTASSPARCLCLPVFAKCNLAPSGSGSVRHPPLPPSLLSHVAPATFLPPLQSKEMTMLKGDSVGEKTERKPFFLKNLLSENLHILFGELMGNSFSWQLCRSAGDRSSSLSGSHTSYLFKAMSWLSYNLQLFIIQSLAAPVKRQLYSSSRV